MESGPRHTFPVHQPDRREDLSLRRPLGHQTHVDTALVNSLGFLCFVFCFALIFLQYHALLCSVWSIWRRTVISQILSKPSMDEQVGRQKPLSIFTHGIACYVLDPFLGSQDTDMSKKQVT